MGHAAARGVQGSRSRRSAMEPRDEELERDREVDEPRIVDDDLAGDGLDEHETHATTGGAAAAGAITGGVIGLTGGPVGAAIGAVGGAIVGAAAERMMHSDDDAERGRSATYRNEYSEGTRDTSVPATDVTMEPTPAGQRSSQPLTTAPPEPATDVGATRQEEEDIRRDRGTTGLP